MSKKIISVIFLIIFTLYSDSEAYDDELTHRDITEKAVMSKECNLKNYLTNNLQFFNGYETMLKGKEIIDWLMDGSENEDSPDCRASNHFHDPLVKDWQLSGLSHKGFESAVI